MNPGNALLVWTVTSAILGSAACSVPIQAGADFSRGTDFSPYRTFAWGPSDALPTGDPRLDNNPFFQERVRAAVEAELTNRGYELVSESADLLVHYHASVRDRVDVFETDREYGYDPEGSTQVVQYEEGTLVVDMADAATKRVLWRGWAQGDLGSALADRDRMERHVQDGVARMFEEFPAAGSGRF